jgi:hypothetical protein
LKRNDFVGVCKIPPQLPGQVMTNGAFTTAHEPYEKNAHESGYFDSSSNPRLIWIPVAGYRQNQCFLKQKPNVQALEKPEAAEVPTQ